MLEVTDLRKSYRGANGVVVALCGADLSVERGRVLGIVGRSGAGKTTLLRCLATLERPDSGEIRLGGRLLTGLSPVAVRRERQRIGLVFQGCNLLARRTAAANIALPLELSGWPRARIERRVEELLERVGLTERRGSFPAQLSGGERQRVAIARAIARAPEVLLLDEATAALDPVTAAAVLALLRQLNRELGLTMIMVTHQMGIVREFCDDVAVLDAGRIVECGPVSRVCTAPRQVVTRRLLEAAV